MNTSVPELRKATHSDLPELLALARTSFLQAFTAGNKPENVQAYLAEAFTEDKLTKEMQEPASTFIVASLGEACRIHQTQLGGCTGRRPRSQICGGGTLVYFGGSLG